MLNQLYTNLKSPPQPLINNKAEKYKKRSVTLSLRTSTMLTFYYEKSSLVTVTPHL